MLKTTAVKKQSRLGSFRWERCLKLEAGSRWWKFIQREWQKPRLSNQGKQHFKKAALKNGQDKPPSIMHTHCKPLSHTHQRMRKHLQGSLTLVLGLWFGKCPTTHIWLARIVTRLPVDQWLSVLAAHSRPAEQFKNITVQASNQTN